MAISNVTLDQAVASIANVVDFVQDTRNKVPVERVAEAIKVQVTLMRMQVRARAADPNTRPHYGDEP